MRKAIAATCIAGALTLGTGSASFANVRAQNGQENGQAQTDNTSNNNDNSDSGKLGLIGLLGLAGLAGLRRRDDRRDAMRGQDAYRGAGAER